MWAGQLRMAGAFTVALAVHGLLAVAIIMMRPSPDIMSDSEPFFEMVDIPEVVASVLPSPALIDDAPVERMAPLSVAQASPIAPVESPDKPLAPVAEVGQEMSRANVETSITALSPAVVATTAAVNADSIPVAEEYVAPDLEVAYRTNPPPAYPTVARRLRLEGVVLLKVSLDFKGYPQQVDIKRSSGHNILDESALQAVKNWRFVPAQRGGQAVVAEVEVPLRFTLR